MMRRNTRCTERLTILRKEFLLRIAGYCALFLFVFAFPLLLWLLLVLQWLKGM